MVVAADQQALGVGLAFGLGGRDTAAQIVAKWYAKAQENPALMRRVAGNMADSHPSPADRRHDLEGG